MINTQDFLICFRLFISRFHYHPFISLNHISTHLKMKAAFYLALGSALLQSVIGLALPVQDVSRGLERVASVQAGTNSPDVGLDLYTRAAADESLAKRSPAAKNKKHCKKTKARRGSSSGEQACPTLPTKAQIKANWKSNPAFNPAKLFFYASPPGADAAEKYAKTNFPGYSTLIPSFHPNGWEDNGLSRTIFQATSGNLLAKHSPKSQPAPSMFSCRTEREALTRGSRHLIGMMSFVSSRRLLPSPRSSASTKRPLTSKPT
jgi:hypothetical protein